MTNKTPSGAKKHHKSESENGLTQYCLNVSQWFLHETIVGVSTFGICANIHTLITPCTLPFFVTSLPPQSLLSYFPPSLIAKSWWLY